MKKNLLLPIAIIIFCAVKLQAQYAFSTYTAPYTELGKSIELEAGNEWDDPNFTINFDFPFSIGGETFNQVTQGGLGAWFSFYSSNIGHEFGYYSDIIDGEVIGASASMISYAVEGLPGNRICKIQYANCAFYNEVYGDEPSANSRVNFQIWLYESNSIIEFHFGENTISGDAPIHNDGAGPLIFIGTGIDNTEETMEYAITLNGNPADPQTANPTYQENPEQLNGNPEDGRVYRFDPSTVGISSRSASAYKVFPNLADTYIQISGLKLAPAEFHILDITGKTIQSGQVVNDQKIDVLTLPSGLYLVHVEGADVASKFVKR